MWRVGVATALGWSLARTATGRRLLATVALQAVGALTLLAQLGLAARILSHLTGTAAAVSVGDLAPLLVALALVTAISAASTSIVAEQRTLLMELIRRYLQERIIGVVVSEEMEELDNPAFHDRLRRATIAYENHPYDIVNGLTAMVALPGSA